MRHGGTGRLIFVYSLLIYSGRSSGERRTRIDVFARKRKESSTCTSMWYESAFPPFFVFLTNAWRRCLPRSPDKRSGWSRWATNKKNETHLLHPTFVSSRLIAKCTVAAPLRGDQAQQEDNLVGVFVKQRYIVCVEYVQSIFCKRGWVFKRRHTYLTLQHLSASYDHTA